MHSDLFVYFNLEIKVFCLGQIKTLSISFGQAGVYFFNIFSCTFSQFFNVDKSKLITFWKWKFMVLHVSDATNRISLKNYSAHKLLLRFCGILPKIQLHIWDLCACVYLLKRYRSAFETFHRNIVHNSLSWFKSINNGCLHAMRRCELKIYYFTTRERTALT